ncbi:PREDICTED: putative nuclear matrix constituent protein 1-like protein [Fragaria vesca subsp. vesca]|uniref:putative nuclear matrix constituent protein 1-like protein n=1 Tax=Fragaria vesca subsp. vesca TaxID=101020 RepID=UPI0002C36541|nr:PREDICTED: putative nuclear matrix constituent protein 1-like protein [Fragaria vesca subsp. vesca]
MFSPLRKAPAALSLTPRNTDKGKAVAYVDGPPPPLGSLSEIRSGGGAKTSPELQNADWRRFKEVGLLDEAAMERRDRQELANKVDRLEAELYDYQHNMGLLLIEKKEWELQHEELSQALAETQEILHREQRAHLIAMSEVESREENLRKILVEEKKAVAELEKSLREMHEEYTRTKRASEAKLADANALIVSVEDKSLVTDEKFLAAEAKLAEANKKSLEVERRLQEVETQENVLRREQASLATEREAHKETFYRQRVDLNEWEKKLKEGEARLSNLRKLLNEKEEKTNENEIILKQKEKDLYEAERKIESSNALLKDKEDDVNRRLADLVSKEKEVDSASYILEMKEKELHALEEKLSSRENVEIQEHLDQHRAILDRKTQAFELGLEERRKEFDKELSSRIDTVEQKELEISHKEEILKKQEKALDEKSERLKEKNKEVEVNLKNLKEREKNFKADEKKLELERQQILVNIEHLQNLKDEIQKIKDENVQLEQQIREGREKHAITEKEKSDHLRLQSELQQEINNYRLQNELLLKEAEDLKQEREKFEKEWEDLDERRAKVDGELRKVVEEKEQLERLQCIEAERLKEERKAVEDYRQREIENLKQERESFTAKMTNGQIALSEKAQSEHAQMVQDFESRRRDLETDMQKRQDKMVKQLQERETAFEEEKDREYTNINFLKGVADKQREELLSERNTNEKEREALALQKKELEANQLEMREDIDQLDKLSKKIKCQREQLIEERGRFLAFVERVKSCKDCGEITREFVLSDLQVPGMYNVEAVPNSEHKESGWGEKLQQKCKLVVSKVTSNKKLDVSTELPRPPAMQKGKEPKLLASEEARGHSSHENEPQPSLRRCNDSANAEAAVADNNCKAVDGYAPSIDDYSFISSQEQDIPEDSEQSELKSGRRKPARGRKSRLSRTHSVKAVVEDAKKFLGETPEPSNASLLNESSYINEGDSSFTSIGRKRPRPRSSRVESEQDDCDSEGRSGSVTAGGHRKRRQPVASAVQTPGGQRYNLRNRKTAGTLAAASAAPHLKSRRKEESKPESVGAELIQVTTLKPVESTEERVVRFATPEPRDTVNGKADATKLVEEAELSTELNGTESSHSTGGESGDSSGDESGDDYDDEDHPGQVSIGKKIWTFFST